MQDRSALYFECHVTIEPVFDERLEQAQAIATRHGFRVADLLMKKRVADTAKRSENDTFMTGRDVSYSALVVKMNALIEQLKREGFKVWRYKIEDTIIDSNRDDVLGLIERVPLQPLMQFTPMELEPAA